MRRIFQSISIIGYPLGTYATAIPVYSLFCPRGLLKIGEQNRGKLVELPFLKGSYLVVYIYIEGLDIICLEIKELKKNQISPQAKLYTAANRGLLPVA